jgi:hypothetical protein
MFMAVDDLGEKGRALLRSAAFLFAVFDYGAQEHCQHRHRGTGSSNTASNPDRTISRLRLTLLGEFFIWRLPSCSVKFWVLAVVVLVVAHVCVVYSIDVGTGRSWREAAVRNSSNTS